MPSSDEVELGDIVSGVVVLGFEHCSPRGEIENHQKALAEKDNGVFSALLDSKVQNLAIFKLTRNLQFSLHWVSHHVHLG